MPRCAIAVMILFTLNLATDAMGQIPNLNTRVVPVDVQSNLLTNNTQQTQTLFQQLVRVDQASSIQIRFGQTLLPEGCLIRMTSMEDGAVQHHRRRTLAQWRNGSAWFNGTTVLVELIAEPGAGPARLDIAHARFLQQLGGERTICGPNDDRTLSNDPRTGRVFPIGCTGWIIDDPNHCFLSAGHCTDDPGDAEIMQFNVPLSDPNGDWNHPGPEDQYAVDPISLQSEITQLGNDWAYYGCFPNTETDLTPYEAQGACFNLADVVPAVDGRDITITGYGTVSSPVDGTWNLAQKTHTGPYAAKDGTAIGYTTDTTGGNSGSAVLDEQTGLAIGIHTNGGCGSGGGNNWGCSIENAGLQNALANPKGVCIPNILNFDFPDGRPDSVLPGTPFELVFEVIAAEQTPVIETITVVLSIDGADEDLLVTSLGDQRYAATIPALECEQDVSYYLQAQGDEGGVATYPFGAPDDRFSLPVGILTETIAMTESFESGLPIGWTATGMWHAATPACGPASECDGSGVFYYGQDDTCNYDNGAEHSGLLSSDPIPVIAGGGDLILSYCSSLITENKSGWDEAVVLVNGVVVDEPSQSSGWETRTVTIPAPGTDTVVVSFSFDTIDALFNEFTGWHVDNIQLVAPGVECDPTTPCLGDTDGNGSVDTNDLLLIIAEWGNQGGPADVNNDGSVNTTDILIVLERWGPCEG